eukprot:1704664-Amphidinium_carterae.2
MQGGRKQTKPITSTKELPMGRLTSRRQLRQLLALKLRLSHFSSSLLQVRQCHPCLCPTHVELLLGTNCPDLHQPTGNLVLLVLVQSILYVLPDSDRIDGFSWGNAPTHRNGKSLTIFEPTLVDKGSKAIE